MNREVMICANDIFYRYPAEYHSAVSDYKKATGIISPCILLAEKSCGGDEDEFDTRNKF